MLLLYRSPDHDRRRAPRAVQRMEALSACGARQVVEALARVGAPLRLYDQHGLVMYESSAFSQLLPVGAERRSTLDAVAALVRRHRAMVMDTCANGANDRQGTVQQFVTVLRGRAVRFVSALLPFDDEVSSALLVFAAPIDHEPLSDTQLRSTFALTTQEIRVARLIAGGLNTPAIASRLGISVHTARRHCERVLSKMGLRSRALVSGALANTE